jgi:hypothetical protein
LEAHLHPTERQQQTQAEQQTSQADPSLTLFHDFDYIFISQLIHLTLQAILKPYLCWFCGFDNLNIH